MFVFLAQIVEITCGPERVVVKALTAEEMARRVQFHMWMYFLFEQEVGTGLLSRRTVPQDVLRSVVL